jgi:hypothetical protein
MITFREEPSLSASERLAAIAELFARGVQRLLATRQRGHSAAGEGPRCALPLERGASRQCKAEPSFRPES